jgi:Ni,Fe-hydrogenase III component G
VVIDAADLGAAVAALHGARWGYLTAITGLDDGPDAGGLQALYHFVGGAAVLTLRVSLPYDNPTVASVCGVLASASFFERELAEMFGVTVVDTPTPTGSSCRTTGRIGPIRCVKTTPTCPRPRPTERRCA